MKYILIIVILVGFTVKCGKGPDFRNLKWGIDTAEVLKLETAKLVAENIIDYGGKNITNNDDNIHYLTFESEEFGVDTYIEYRIGLIGLSEACYRFPFTTDPNDQKMLMERILSKYNDELGEPEVIQGGMIYHWKSPKYDVTFSYMTKPLLQFTPHDDKSIAQMLKEAQETLKQYK